MFHERDSTVRLAHHTVGQFLDQNNGGRSQTNIRIGEICLTYLGFSDFETQVVSVRNKQEPFGNSSRKPAELNLCPQVVGLINVIIHILIWLWVVSRNGSWPEPDVNYAELMRRYQKMPLSDSFDQKYVFLEYVTANWVWHASSFDPVFVESWSRFAELVFEKALSFDFKPWGELKGPSNLPHLGMFLWALDNNHLPLLLLLRAFPGHRPLKHYFEYKTLRRNESSLHLQTRTAETAPDINVQGPVAYSWPAIEMFLNGSMDLIDFFLQEDPLSLPNRLIVDCLWEDCNSKTLSTLLQHGLELHKTKDEVKIAFYNACRQGNHGFLELLLNYGADVNSSWSGNKAGETPLSQALLSEKPGVRIHGGSCKDYGYTSSRLVTTQLLLDRGAHPNAVDSKGQVPLMMAVQNKTDDAAIVQSLIRHGADVHAKDFAGQTVLHHVRSSSSGTLRQLLELGMDVNATDEKGRTALWSAIYQDNCEKFKLLLEFGADFRVDRSPLMPIFTAGGNEEMVDILLSIGSDPNTMGDFKSSPLSWAAHRGNEIAATALLQAGADPNLVDAELWPPLSRAVKTGNTKIVKKLIQAGAAIHPPDSIVNSPLHVAIAANDFDMVEYLIEQGADITRV